MISYARSYLWYHTYDIAYDNLWYTMLRKWYYDIIEKLWYHSSARFQMSVMYTRPAVALAVRFMARLSGWDASQYGPRASHPLAGPARGRRPRPPSAPRLESLVPGVFKPAEASRKDSEGSLGTGPAPCEHRAAEVRLGALWSPWRLKTPSWC